MGNVQNNNQIEKKTHLIEFLPQHEEDGVQEVDHSHNAIIVSEFDQHHRIFVS